MWGEREREEWEGIPESQCETKGPLVDPVLEYWGDHVTFYTLGPS